MWWHLALFHIDLEQHDRALEIFDDHLNSADPEGNKREELDASALLWRLKLLNVDVGDRWHGLAEKWERSAKDTLYAFNDVHAMMTFVCDGRDETARSMPNATERYADHASDPMSG